MEQITLLLSESTVEMLHLLARESGQTIGTVVHEMALDRYMHRAMDGVRFADSAAEYLLDADVSVAQKT
ncbi:hypothetical protein SAMN04488117_10635 [Celeribacter baekdonensis]|uniref:Uncharacterized protein n=1 Tax=Celeribacter baekdonensis TaxID=875171 RepID=A0A1G7MT02_9RHOB|nr:hypothetical protein [Celeribacter baekdonensis]SDF64903.1 hypothetical protein SAMN04488117_10635 [Celeribacter baekdonensis]